MNSPVVPFQYESKSHSRRHGPQGYSDPQRYKPWLRDEFAYRCVYCLTRERWCPDGEDAFSVEHFHPQALTPDADSKYDNLLYTCCRCNAAKRDLIGVLNPAEVPLAEHLEILADGSIRGLTEAGWDLIHVCQLNRPNLEDYRRAMFDLLRAVSKLGDDAQRQVLRRYFGFPSNLPKLSTLRPPTGNSRPDGIATSAHERKKRGELPDSY